MILEVLKANAVMTLVAWAGIMIGWGLYCLLHKERG